MAKLARDQLSRIDPAHHELKINMIGAIKEISTLGLDSAVAEQTTIRHYKEGDENLTLHDLWSYCQDAPPSQVRAPILEIHANFDGFRNVDGSPPQVCLFRSAVHDVVDEVDVMSICYYCLFWIPRIA